MPAAIYPTEPIYAGDTWPGIPSISIRPNNEIPSVAAGSAKLIFFKAEDGPGSPSLTLQSSDDITLVNADDWEFDVPPMILNLEPGEWTFRFSTTNAGETFATGGIEFLPGAYSVIGGGNTFTIGEIVITTGCDLGTSFASNEGIVDAMLFLINESTPGMFLVTAVKASPDKITFTAKAGGSIGNHIEIATDFGTPGTDYVLTPMSGGSPAITRTWIVGTLSVL